jgi:hypothetical protein
LNLFEIIKYFCLDAKSIPRRSTTTSGTEEDQNIVGFDGDQSFVFGTSAGGLLLGTSSLDTSNNNLLRNASTGSSLSNSEQQLPSIDEENLEIQQQKKGELSPEMVVDREKRRTVSDMHCDSNNSKGF